MYVQAWCFVLHLMTYSTLVFHFFSSVRPFLRSRCVCLCVSASFPFSFCFFVAEGAPEHAAKQRPRTAAGCGWPREEDGRDVQAPHDAPGQGLCCTVAGDAFSCYCSWTRTAVATCQVHLYRTLAGTPISSFTAYLVPGVFYPCPNPKPS